MTNAQASAACGVLCAAIHGTTLGCICACVSGAHAAKKTIMLEREHLWTWCISRAAFSEKLEYNADLPSLSTSSWPFYLFFRPNGSKLCLSSSELLFENHAHTRQQTSSCCFAGVKWQGHSCSLRLAVVVIASVARYLVCVPEQLEILDVPCPQKLGRSVTALGSRLQNRIALTFFSNKPTRVEKAQHIATIPPPLHPPPEPRRRQAPSATKGSPKLREGARRRESRRESWRAYTFALAPARVWAISTRQEVCCTTARCFVFRWSSG